MKKVFIQTHGCQMNEYDSAKMLELLGEKSDFQTTENEAEAEEKKHKKEYSIKLAAGKF